MSTNVIRTIDGAVAQIVLRSEGGVNVLSTEVLKDLGRAIAEISANRAVRQTVVSAEGKVFIAGADIKEMAGFNHEEARNYGLLGLGVFDDLELMPSITVAAINGAAMGGGLELALACDFRIAVKSAKLGLPEATLGLIPGWGGIGRLSRLIGPARARKLYLSGAAVGAEEGFAIGLVDEVVNSLEDLSGRVQAFCRLFSKAGPCAVSLAKRAAKFGDDAATFASCFETPESREGMRAFMEKRSASWMQ